MTDWIYHLKKVIGMYGVHGQWELSVNLLQPYALFIISNQKISFIFWVVSVI